MDIKKLKPLVPLVVIGGAVYIIYLLTKNGMVDSSGNQQEQPGTAQSGLPQSFAPQIGPYIPGPTPNISVGGNNYGGTELGGSSIGGNTYGAITGPDFSKYLIALFPPAVATDKTSGSGGDSCGCQKPCQNFASVFSDGTGNTGVTTTVGKQVVNSPPLHTDGSFFNVQRVIKDPVAMVAKTANDLVTTAEGGTPAGPTFKELTTWLG